MPSVCDWALVALPSIAICPALQKKNPRRPIDPSERGKTSAPRRPEGWGGAESRGSITATQRHALIFLSLRNWKSVTQLLRNVQNRRWVLPLHVTLIPLQSTPEQATDLPSYMTLIPLQSDPKRAIALASPATLISLQSAQIAGERDSTIALCKTDSRALGCCYEEQGQRKSQQREAQASEPR